MSEEHSEKKMIPPPPVRRSSIKGLNLPNDLNNLRRNPNKRHTVSFRQNNSFKYKEMRAMFEECADPIESKITEERHKIFESKRKIRTQNEYTNVKEMLKHQESIVEEDDDEKNDETTKKNTNKNKSGDYKDDDINNDNKDN